MFGTSLLFTDYSVDMDNFFLMINKVVFKLF